MGEINLPKNITRLLKGYRVRSLDIILEVGNKDASQEDKMVDTKKQRLSIAAC
jgi:hypothetical protein